MRDDKTPKLALPLPSPHNTLEEDVTRLRNALMVIDAALAEAGKTIPLASASENGLMSSADVAVLADLLTAVEFLSGRASRYPVHLEGIEINQDLQAAYETASGKAGAPVDGTTLVDLDSNIAYTWYASVDEWVNRGSDTVSVAANGVLGVVKGDAEETPGKVYVESDGSMSIIGWDALVAGAGSVRESDNHTWTAAQRGAIVQLPSATVITPNFALANNFALTLAHNGLLANPTNMVPGQSGVIAITQDATGGRTLVFGSCYKFPSGMAPALSASAGHVDYISYYVETAERIAVLFRGEIR
jgi:hypothetical protein